MILVRSVFSQERHGGMCDTMICRAHTAKMVLSGRSRRPLSTIFLKFYSRKATSQAAMPAWISDFGFDRTEKGTCLKMFPIRKVFCHEREKVKRHGQKLLIHIISIIIF